jgi:hypothetical protein
LQNSVSLCVSTYRVFNHVFVNPEVGVGVELVVSVLIILDEVVVYPPFVTVSKTFFNSRVILILETCGFYFFLNFLVQIFLL